jgi:hypothetical protein
MKFKVKILESDSDEMHSENTKKTINNLVAAYSSYQGPAVFGRQQ